MLEDIAPLILKISRKQDLTSEESRKLFQIIGNEDKTSFFFLAATMGLMSKGPTPDELYGICLDRAQRIPKIKTKVKPKNIIDISGGGGDKIKTLNVGTAASIVAASSGKIHATKQTAPAITGFTGSNDILNEIGIETAPAGMPEILADCLEKTNFTAFDYAMLNPDKFANFLKWRGKIKELGLKYITPYHLISFAYSPFEMFNRIYGLADEKYLKDVAGILQKFGCERIITLTGLDGLDEISNVGQTKIYELTETGKREYIIKPEDLGVKPAKTAEIETHSREENIKTFLEILFNKETGAKKDLVCVNAGAIFYLTGKTKTIKDGARLSRLLIEKRQAGKKLEQIVDFYGNRSKLKKLKKLFRL